MIVANGNIQGEARSYTNEHKINIGKNSQPTFNSKTMQIAATSPISLNQLIVLIILLCALLIFNIRGWRWFIAGEVNKNLNYWKRRNNDRKEVEAGTISFNRKDDAYR